MNTNDEEKVLKEFAEALGKMYQNAMLKGFVIGGTSMFVGCMIGMITADIKWSDVKAFFKKKFHKKGAA
jgi:hypothetical protein